MPEIHDGYFQIVIPDLEHKFLNICKVLVADWRIDDGTDVEAKIAQGLAAVKAGRVIGPFNNMAEFEKQLEAEKQ